jgi:hypothetical protein
MTTAGTLPQPVSHARTAIWIARFLKKCDTTCEERKMATPVSDKAAVDVPARVFEKYLQALVEAKASPEVISRLRATLLEDKSFTERALKDAIFGEEIQP